MSDAFKLEVAASLRGRVARDRARTHFCPPGKIAAVARDHELGLRHNEAEIVQLFIPAIASVLFRLIFVGG